MPAAPAPPRAKRTRPKKSPDAAIFEGVALTELQDDVLARVAKDDGYPVALDTLKRSLLVSFLEISNAVDRLEALGLVETDEDGGQDVVSLTAIGRQYVLDNGLAR
jgi:hypothetical protein